MYIGASFSTPMIVTPGEEERLVGQEFPVKDAVGRVIGRGRITAVERDEIVTGALKADLRVKVDMEVDAVLIPDWPHRDLSYLSISDGHHGG